MLVARFSFYTFYRFNMSVWCKRINLSFRKIMLQILCQSPCYSKNFIREAIYKVQFFLIITKFPLRKFMNQPKMFDILVSCSKCTLKNIDRITDDKVYLVLYNNISNIFNILIVRVHSHKMITW